MLQPDERLRFERLVLPHLDAAVNLGRWLLRNRADAEDVAQDAMLRAYRFFGNFRGGDARAWLLQILRNSCYTWLEKNRPLELMTEFDEQTHQRPTPDPESLAARESLYSPNPFHHARRHALLPLRRRASGIAGRGHARCARDARPSRDGRPRDASPPRHGVSKRDRYAVTLSCDALQPSLT